MNHRFLSLVAGSSRAPWPLTLRLAGYVTCLEATVGIGIQAGANHPAELVAVVLGSLAFTLAFHVLTISWGLSRQAVLGLVATQLVLATAILLVAGCTGSELLMFVLAAELQMVFSLRWAVAGTVGLWLLSVVCISISGLKSSGESFGEFLATSPAGFAFVAAFTHNALGERRARLRATELLQELNEANAQLRQYAEQVEELVVARERNRMAGEIHDTLGHYLAVINIQLETAKKLYERDPAASLAALSTAKSQATEALNEVRRSVAALRPAALEFGLAEALAHFVDSLRKTTSTNVHVETHTGGRLRPEVEVAVYRVIQEALTNVRKHAAAGNVWIRPRWDQEVFDGSVRDDGQGADVVDGSGSFGLQSMRERLGGVGGTLKTESRPGAGFLVTLHIPRPVDAAPAYDEASSATQSPERAKPDYAAGLRTARGN